MAIVSSQPSTQVNGKPNGHVHQVENGLPQPDGFSHDDSRYAIRESPMGTKRPLRVIFMGMGCSGINFAYQLERRMKNVELAIYEKNDDLGGTWLENKYPGCACDIPSVSYQFTWQRKPDWSHYYSGSKEIYDYFKQISTSNNLEQYAKFNHRIIGAEWLDGQGKWKITVMRNNDPSDTIEDFADFFLNGGGFLNTWKWPDISGLTSFQGPTIHTACWDDEVDLKGKKVLVIGAGSSAVQVVPSIVNTVDQLYVVARSPTWITAGFAPKYAGKNGENFVYSEDTKQRFRDDPAFYLAYCKAVESELNLRFRIVINDSPEAVEAITYSRKEMQRKLAGKPELMEKIIPRNFGIGCRRPTPGNGFLEALTLDKTVVFTENIKMITTTGFVSADSKHHEVDVIICATGFDTSFRPAFPLVANGRNVQDDYSEKDPIGYLGFAEPEVPNYFVFVNRYGPLGHGSTIPMVEAYTNYILQVLEKVQVEDIKKLQVKRFVAEQFIKHADLYLDRTAWTGPCSSWFKGGDSTHKPMIWPGSRIHYLSILQKPRFEDYDIEYHSGNVFGFLGNGFDVRESDGRDLTWYYGLLDGKDEQPKSLPSAVF